jgi:prevent-host-death family protein
MDIGIRELKNQLSKYLKIVRQGKTIAITQRGKIIAYMTPSNRSQELEDLMALIQEGKAHWKGGKPAGLKRLVKITGKPVSRIVIEDRR